MSHWSRRNIRQEELRDRIINEMWKTYYAPRVQRVIPTARDKHIKLSNAKENCRALICIELMEDVHGF